eukprot:TRINITY_DN54256_c0_g1_i1.p3 TRINITY_DN54256_c0_g1~~TRINITY_DN54256_c0_g1_i1.p3  ORF type:complete len:174 (-),score=41.87 TRINITY_DN54256_c0_g1_i1:140-661(-)
MGCGASATRTATSQASFLKQIVVGKPVKGGEPSDVVRGSPAVLLASTTPGKAIPVDDAEKARLAKIVEGLAEAAAAISASSPALAAGLARMAAGVAEDMPPPAPAATAGTGEPELPGQVPDVEDVSPQVAVGLADAAISAAKVGSKTASGLTIMASSAAKATARSRSGSRTRA